LARPNFYGLYLKRRHAVPHSTPNLSALGRPVPNEFFYQK